MPGTHDQTLAGAVSAPQQRIFTRDFVLLFLSNLILTSVYFLLMTTMALYAEVAYGADGALAGTTASVFMVGGVIGRVVSGRYASYVGLKRMGVAALVVQLVACVLYLIDAQADVGIGVLIGIRVLHGLGFGVGNTVVPALAVERLPRERLGEGTGYFMLSQSLGCGVGPLLAILVVAGLDYSILFIVCTALAVVSLVVTLLVRTERDGHAAPAPAPAKPGPFTLGSVIDLSTVRLSVFMFLVAFGYSSLNSYVNGYATELGMGVYAPFVFLTYAIVLVVTRPTTGRWMDERGESFVLYPSILSMALGLVLAANVVDPSMLVACGIFMATGFGTCMSVGQATATKLTRDGNTALAISTFFLLCDGGCAIGPIVLGFVVSAAGYRAMYWVAAGVALVALVYYYFAHGRAVSAQRKGA